MLVCKLVSVIRAVGVFEHAGINSTGQAGGKSDSGKISNFRTIVEIRAGHSVKPAAGIDSRIRDRDIIIQSTGRRSGSCEPAGAVRLYHCRGAVSSIRCTQPIYASLTDDWMRRLPGRLGEYYWQGRSNKSTEQDLECLMKRDVASIQRLIKLIKRC